MARKGTKKKKAARKAARKKPAKGAARKRKVRADAAPIAESLAIAVPAERVWAALTSPRDLGLLTLGRIEMSAKPGAAFRWHWGVWEKVAPAGKKASFVWEGLVLDVVPGSTLVLGPYPLTTLTVKGEGGSALVTVLQPPPSAGDSEDS